MIETIMEKGDEGFVYKKKEKKRKPICCSFICQRSTCTTFLDEIIEHTTTDLIKLLLTLYTVDSFLILYCLFDKITDRKLSVWPSTVDLYCLSDKFTDVLLFARVNY